MNIRQLLEHYRIDRNYAKYVLDTCGHKRSGICLDSMKCAGKCGFTYDWTDKYFNRRSALQLKVVCKACEQATWGKSYQFCKVCGELKLRTIKNFALYTKKPRKYQRVCRDCWGK